MALERQIRNAVRRLRDRARRIVPGFAIAPLGEAEIWLLLDSARITVSMEDIGPAKILAPRVEGGRGLALRKDISRLSAKFLILGEVARTWMDDHPRGRLLADVFAAAGVLPDLEAGASWESLAEIDLVWFGSFGEALFRAARGAVDVQPNAAPGTARGLLEAARTKRAASLYASAERLFLRSLREARRAEEWDVAVRALQGLSTLSLRQRDHGSARRWAMRALRVAVECGVRDQVGPVRHDLYVIEAHDGHDGRALAHAREALRAYRHDHDHFVPFCHDVGWYFVERGLFLGAIPLLRGVAELVWNPTDRIRVLGNLAVACGGASAEREFDRVRGELSGLLLSHSSADSVPAGHLSIAQGALHLNRWSLAAAAAKAAEEEAAARDQAGVRADAIAAREAAVNEEGFPIRPSPLSPRLVAGWREVASELESTVAQLALVPRVALAEA